MVKEQIEQQEALEAEWRAQQEAFAAEEAAKAALAAANANGLDVGYGYGDSFFEDGGFSGVEMGVEGGVRKEMVVMEGDVGGRVGTGALAGVGAGAAAAGGGVAAGWQRRVQGRGLGGGLGQPCSDVWSNGEGLGVAGEGTPGPGGIVGGAQGASGSWLEGVAPGQAPLPLLLPWLPQWDSALCRVVPKVSLSKRPNQQGLQQVLLADVPWAVVAEQLLKEAAVAMDLEVGDVPALAAVLVTPERCQVQKYEQKYDMYV